MISCPICARPSAPEFRPFCSKRCADIDLAKWLTGSYRVPAAPDDEAESIENEPGEDRDTAH